MFSEVLRIKPVLDAAAAKQMENSLNKRFQRIGKVFSSGLKMAIKGSILGISLGLLNKLLNPIEALEEKIKTLLGQGTDIKDLAGDFNTSPGQIKRLQDVAQSLGVQPDQLKDLMEKYAAAIDSATKELADPFVKPSEQTQAVRNFVGEKDMAEGFFKFLQSLRAEGQGPGRTQVVGDPTHNITRQLSGVESRKEFERAVFGDTLKGGNRKLVETDLGQQFGKINEPSAARLTKAVNKTAELADQQRILQTKNDTKNFVDTSDQLNSKMISDMEAARAREEAKVTRRLDIYDEVRRAADGIEVLKEKFENLGIGVAKAAGALGNVSEIAQKFKHAPLFIRPFLGRGKSK